MWYNLCQDDIYLLQGAITAYMTDLYKNKAAMPVFEDIIDRDIRNLNRIRILLYDSGVSDLSDIKP